MNAAVLVFGLLHFVVAQTQEPSEIASESKAIAEEAARVQEAYEEGSDPRPSRFDPWLVTDFLLEQGHRATALRHVSQYPIPVRGPLGKYIAAERDGSAFDAIFEASGTKMLDLERLRRVESSNPFHLAILAQRIAELESSPEAIIRSLQVAAREAEKIDWYRGAAIAHFGLGQLLRPRDTEGATLAFLRAGDAFFESGESSNAATAYLRHGNLCIQLARYAQAARSLRKVVDLSPSGEERLLGLQNLALVSVRRGKVRVALDSASAALALARLLDSREQEAYAHYYLALAKAIAGVPLQAEDHALEAIQAFEGLGQEMMTAESWSLLGFVQERGGEYEEALGSIEIAIELYEEYGLPLEVAEARSAKALTLLQSGRLKEALAIQQEAYEFAVTQEDLHLLAHAQFHLAQIHFAQENLKASRERTDELLELAARMKSPRLLRYGHWMSARLFFAEGQSANALLAAEEAVIHSLGNVAGLSPLDSAIARDYRFEAFELYRKASRVASDQEQLLKSIELCRAYTLNQAFDRSSQSSPPLVGTDLLSIDLNQLRKRLSANEIVVAFFFEELDLFALRISREGARTIRIAPITDILDLLDRPSDGGGVLRGIGRRRSKKGLNRSWANRFRKLVFDPLELPAEGHRLILSPEGPLAFAPMQLAVSGLEVVYTPSVRVWEQLATEGKRKHSGVLALGNPKRSGAELEPLPGSELEALAISEDALIGPQATRTRWLEKLRARDSWRALHFACHAVIAPEQPHQSYLALADEGGNETRLSVLDVFDLDIDVDLVVLSACQTGIGKLHLSDGVFGFTQAFLAAGARSVLVSTWRVNDEATRVFMLEFYKHWNAGDSPATALSKAQKYVASHPKWSSPEYWAAWQLWGAPD